MPDLVSSVTFTRDDLDRLARWCDLTVVPESAYTHAVHTREISNATAAL